MDRLVSKGDVPLQGLGASENTEWLKGTAGLLGLYKWRSQEGGRDRSLRSN